MLRSFLLKCSGASPDILEECPKHETTIQTGIGSIILVTAALAFFSGAYAIHTVFKSFWASIAFGVLWSLIIFSIDRFVITTTKKSGNFWNEFRSCLPRLVLAVAIGVTISEPLKLELFRGEIEEELAANNAGIADIKKEMAAPVMSKMIRPKGPYDYILDRIDEAVQFEQEGISRVNKTFYGKEFVEHAWSRKVDETRYDAVRSILERNRMFNNHIIHEKNAFHDLLATIFLRLKGIRNEKLAKNEHASVDRMLNAFYEAEERSYEKFRNGPRASKDTSPSTSSSEAASGTHPNLRAVRGEAGI